MAFFVICSCEVPNCTLMPGLQSGHAFKFVGMKASAGSTSWNVLYPTGTSKRKSRRGMTLLFAKRLKAWWLLLGVLLPFVRVMGHTLLLLNVFVVGSINT